MAPFRRHRLFGLLIGFLLLVALMATGLKDPLIDAHAWRQTETATMARNFYRGGYRLLYPQVDWRGVTPGYVESEFPLYQYIVALVYGIFGFNDFLGRAVSIAFSLGTSASLFLLARTYFGHRAGWLALLGLATSPLFIFFGRAVMPEPAMLFFSVTLLYVYTKWLDTGNRWFLTLSILLASLAFLVKLPTLYLLVPLVVLSYIRWGWRVVVQPRLWIALGLSLLGPLLWYTHAAQLRELTGLSFGIWEFGKDKWGNIGTWLDPEFYSVLGARLLHEVTSPLGLLLAAAGIALRASGQREKVGRVLLFAWTACLVVYIFLIANGNVVHNYYQLPFVPLVALGIGRVLSRIIDLGRRYGARNAALAACAVPLVWMLVLTLLVTGISRSRNFVNTFYRQVPMSEYSLVHEAGHAIRRLTRPDDLLVVGTDMPYLPEPFYYSDRKGWPISLAACSMDEVATKVPMGADYLALFLVRTTSDAFISTPCAERLESRFTEIASGDHWLLYQLQ